MDGYMLGAKMVLIFLVFLIAMLLILLADLWEKTAPAREKGESSHD